LPPSSTLKMDAAHFSEVSVMVNQSTQYHITENIYFHSDLVIRYMCEGIAQTIVSCILERHF
jgi:hypothetical protein